MQIGKVTIGEREQALLVAAGAVVVVLAVIRFAYAPLLRHLSTQRATLQELRVKIADAGVVSQQRAAEEQALQESRRRSQTVETRLGARPSVARILEALSGQAKAQRCELVVVQPRAGGQETRSATLGPDIRLREVPLNLKLMGRYPQIGEFLGWLPNAPFLGAVRSIVVSQPDEANPQLQADVELAIYVSEESST